MEEGEVDSKETLMPRSILKNGWGIQVTGAKTVSNAYNRTRHFFPKLVDYLKQISRGIEP
jgi:hypothetical protein